MGELGGREVEMLDKVLLIYQRMKVVEFLSFPKCLLPVSLYSILKPEEQGRGLMGNSDVVL